MSLYSIFVCRLDKVKRGFEPIREEIMKVRNALTLLYATIFSLVLGCAVQNNQALKEKREVYVAPWSTSRNLDFDEMFLWKVHLESKIRIPEYLVEEYALLHSVSYDEYKARKKTGIGVSTFLEEKRNEIVVGLNKIEERTYRSMGLLEFKMYNNSLKGFPIWDDKNVRVGFEYENSNMKKSALIVPSTGERLINPMTGDLFPASDVPYLRGALWLDTRGWYIPIMAEDSAAEYLVRRTQVSGESKIRIVLTYAIKSCIKEFEHNAPIISCEGIINGGYVYNQNDQRISDRMRPIVALKKVEP